MIKKTTIFSFMLILVFCVAFARFLQAEERQDLTKIKVFTQNGNEVVFFAETAVTKEQLGTGLMFRASLPERQGMLFDFGGNHIPYMWMKNTLIPLDMLFIDENGKITFIAGNSQPHSTDTVSPPSFVRYVLEINGGEAAKLGISEGDTIRLADD